MATAAPQIVKISGAWVVDYGLTWFRVNDDGSLVKRVASPSGVKSPKLKSGEATRVRKLLASHLEKMK